MKVNEQIVLNKIRKILEKIKKENSFKELEFVVDRASTSIQKYIITIIFKGEEYIHDTYLEVYLNKINEDSLYKMFMVKIREFYEDSKKIDDILVSLKNEAIKLFNKFVRTIPKDIEIIPDIKPEEDLYEVVINFKDAGVKIALQYTYDNNKLELFGVYIEPTTVKGEKEVYKLLEGIISYLLVKKLFS